MNQYTFIKINPAQYGVYYSVYGVNIYMSYDWMDLKSSSRPNSDGTLICKNGEPIGGFVVENHRISLPFLVPPFQDKTEFWEVVLNSSLSCESCILYLDNIPESDADHLLSFGAAKRQSQRRMSRPTAEYDIKLTDEFHFTVPDEKEMDEIIQVVYEAHSAGYTSVINGKPNISSITEAINRRFRLFRQTDTLSFGTIIKANDTKKITGVCIAGIYPDSPNDFSTIHQVSVLPEYQRKGLAQAIIRNTINTANKRSPVIGLGVLVGNPAEVLYHKLGFLPGPTYVDLVYKR